MTLEDELVNKEREALSPNLSVFLESDNIFTSFVKMYLTDENDNLKELKDIKYYKKNYKNYADYTGCVETGNYILQVVYGEIGKTQIIDFKKTITVNNEFSIHGFYLDRPEYN